MDINNIKRDGLTLQFASYTDKRDKEVCMAAVTQNGLSLEYAKYRDNEIIKTAIAQNWKASTFVPNCLEDPEVLMLIVKQSLSAIRSVKKQIDVADYDTILRLAQANGNILEYIPKHFQSDPDITYEAVKQSWKALRYASVECKDNKKIVLSAVKQSGSALRYASTRLKRNREVVSVAVKQDGGSLMYVADELRCDRDIILTAVKQMGSVLEFASDSLKDDQEVVFTAMSVDKRALKHASMSLQKGGLHAYVKSVVCRYSISAEVFRSVFILGLRTSAASQSSDDAQVIALHKLNYLGEEALLEFLISIAEYAGVKAGERWDNLIWASLNLRNLIRLYPF